MFLKIIQTSVIWFLINGCALSTHSLETIGNGTAEQTPADSSPFKTTVGIELLKRSKAAEIKSWMNTTEDPCNDFYNYACGNWKRINSAEVQKRFFSNKYQVIYTAMERRTEKFLSQPKEGNPMDDTVRDFYQSCQNVGSSNVFKSELKAIFYEFGHFTFLKTRKVMEVARKKFTWWAAVAQIYYDYGLSFIINVNLDDHIERPNRTMIFLERAENIAVRSTKEMLNLFATLFLGATNDEASQLVSNLEKFEQALTDAGTAANSGRTPREHYVLYNTTTLKEKYRDLFDVEVFLQMALNVRRLPPQIFVSDTKYFDDLLTIFNATDPNTVEDYVLWSLVEEYIVGILTCTSTANRYFGKYLQHTIYQEFRTPEYEKELLGLWDDLRGVFRSGLQNNQYYWMTNETRQNAIRKLNKTEFVLNTYDNENFELFFQDLTIAPNNFVANVRNVLRRIKFTQGRNLKRTPVSLNDFQRESFNPRYYDRRNQIIFPISILQPFHIWHTEYPKAIMYSTWGSVMAHEMLHAFDDFGRHFDGNGSANTWWDKQSFKGYEERRKCFQEQYAKYTFEGQRLPNSTVQRENIADNGAVRIAYVAYQQWFDRYKRFAKDIYASENFSTLSYNNRQLFFISYAQFWCEDIHPEYHSFYVNKEPHGPSKFRIIGALSNFPTFSLIFKCAIPENTTSTTAIAAMNPWKKCEVF